MRNVWNNQSQTKHGEIIYIIRTVCDANFACMCMHIYMRNINGTDDTRNGLMTLLIIRFSILQHLELSYNAIYEIDQEAFKGLYVLQSLEISHNLLINAPSISYVKNTLQLLDLSWNNIISISKTYFDSCNHIDSILIARNQLSAIPNIKEVSKTLQYLDLADNNISDTKPLNDIHLPKLKRLALSENQITRFCFPSLTTYLSEVTLSSNRLSVIYFSQLNATRFATVDVSMENNPWHCNGSLGWTKYCIPQQQAYMLCMGWLWVDEIICTSPDDIKGLTPREAGMCLLP